MKNCGGVPGSGCCRRRSSWSDERGYEATTLGDIADRAGSARGLVSYYFPGKRQLLQSAVHRLMHLTLEAALEREPRTEDGRERMARAIDAILGLAP